MDVETKLVSGELGSWHKMEGPWANEKPPFPPSFLFYFQLSLLPTFHPPFHTAMAALNPQATRKS